MAASEIFTQPKPTGPVIEIINDEIGRNKFKIVSMGAYSRYVKTKGYDNVNFIHLRLTQDDYNELLTILKRVYKQREHERAKRAANGPLSRERSIKPKVNIFVEGITRQLVSDGKVIQTDFKPLQYIENI